MTETTQKVRAEFREYAERTGDEELQSLVRDADRLQRAEELLGEVQDRLNDMQIACDESRLSTDLEQIAAKDRVWNWEHRLADFLGERNDL